VFARASAPTNGSVEGFGDQVADAEGDAVAYADTFVNRPGGVVYLLRAGDRGGTAIVRSWTARVVCAPVLSWHDRWLQYAPGGGDAVVLDTGVGTRIDLTTVVRGLPGRSRMVRWAYANTGPHLAADR
jgi:hypothetical protein